MIALQSITEFFTTYGRRRKSPRKTLAALVWALLRQPLLGIAAMGHSLAMAHTPSAKHAIKRVDRFLGKEGIDLEVACGDLMATVIGSAREVYLTLDWTDPKTKDGQFHTLRCNVRAHGRAMPIAWTTVKKDQLKHRMREYEPALCERVARLLPSGCHGILLADRGFATVQFFRAVDTLGWDGIIRSKGNILVFWAEHGLPLILLGKRRPAQIDSPVRYGKQAQGGSYAGRLVVYVDSTHADPWFLIVSAGLADRTWGQIVAAYGPRFPWEESYTDQKNNPVAGFHRNCVP